MATGSGGFAAVGSLVLTVVGYDTLTQGAQMLWTPDRQSSERGRAVSRIAAGLGASVVIRYATTRTTRVAASNQNIRQIPRGQLDEAQYARKGVIVAKRLD